MHQKEVTLPKERFALCPQLEDGNLSAWDVLPDNGIFVYLGTLGHTRYTKIALTYGRAYINSTSRGSSG